MTYMIVNVLLSSSVFFRDAEAQFPYAPKLGHNPYDECVGCPPESTYASYNEECDPQSLLRECQKDLVCRYTDYGFRCKYAEATKAGRGELCGDSYFDLLAGLPVQCQYPLACLYDSYTPGTKSGTGYTCQDAKKPSPSKKQQGETCQYDYECASGLSCNYEYIRGGKAYICTPSSTSSPVGFGRRRAVGRFLDTATGASYDSKVTLSKATLGATPLAVRLGNCPGCPPDHLFAQLGDHCSSSIPCVGGLVCKYGVIPGGYNMRCEPLERLGEGEPCGIDAVESVTACEDPLQCSYGVIPGGYGYTCQFLGAGSASLAAPKLGSSGGDPAPGQWLDPEFEKKCKAQDCCITSWMEGFMKMVKVYSCVPCSKSSNQNCLGRQP